MTETLDFQRLQNITLEDRKVFEDYFERFPPTISEYTFAGLFIWRHYYQFLWGEWKNSLIIMVQPPDSAQPYFFPPVGPENALEEVYNDLLETLATSSFMPTIERIPEEDLKKYFANDSHLQSEQDAEHSDYIYAIPYFLDAEFGKNKKFLEKLRRFRELNSYTYRPLDKDLARDCLELAEDWCILRDTIRYPGIIGEQKAICESLIHYAELGCRGGIILIENKVEALILGDRLSPQAGVVYAAKANPEREGLLENLYHHFCIENLSDQKLLNLGPDLGNETVRAIRLSFHPVQMQYKYMIYRPSHRSHS